MPLRWGAALCAEIYRDRGLSPALARKVAIEFTEKDVIRAHARDELVRRRCCQHMPYLEVHSLSMKQRRIRPNNGRTDEGYRRRSNAER